MRLRLLLGLVTAFGLGAAPQTWTGQISDDMCSGDHNAMAHDGKKVDAHECTLVFTKGGSKFVFVSSGKVYAIANQNLPDLSRHAGHSVKVTGDVGSDGKTISISKVEMIQ